MGWLVAVNSQATRDSLEWATQVDSHSCGPLSCAAACLLLQGIKPTASALGLKSSNLARGESRKLRTSVLQLVLAMAARDPANEIFFTPKVKKQLENLPNSAHLHAYEYDLDVTQDEKSAGLFNFIRLKKGPPKDAHFGWLTHMSPGTNIVLAVKS
ncbi:hypothetical protein TREMEDRAFT_62671 [Tremella mesenterica DSM 1558]|nr:uncharacterized protein TREMEDRAFT_62671 [Tremella mesenterica DSM 1558]EIW68958.1 hypothetical protein TREMEDRAFT_62671 [Tremella mesenterica DSM 1558]